MFRWLRKAFGGNAQPTRLREAVRGRPSGAELTGERRYEAAQTDRLNSAHWVNAKGESVNDVLELDLPTLCDRCVYEAANNGFVDGVINTYATDVVGDHGPTLQVISDDEAYNEAVEDGWSEFWKMPDVNGRLAGPELLDLWIRNLWTKGGYLVQQVTQKAADTLVKLRVKSINPERLQTPPGQATDYRIVSGVEVDEDGTPVKYHVQNVKYGQPNLISVDDFKAIDARHMLHVFKMIEDDQVRGVPWLAPVLPSAADLRDFDAQTLDAARAAADWAIVLYTDHPDSKFLMVNGSMQVERRQISTMPPGWKPMVTTPQHPTANYIDYRAERHRELGRPVDMPLMKVRLDASKHSYSSARFDGQGYWRGVSKFQAFVSRTTLNPLLSEVQREVELSRGLKRPKKVLIVWTWPKAPHVDPAKEAKGTDIKLKNLTETLTGALAADGETLEEHLAQLKREMRAFDSAGLLDLWKAAMGIGEPEAGDQESQGAGEADDDERPGAARELVREILEELLDERHIKVMAA